MLLRLGCADTTNRCYTPSSHLGPAPLVQSPDPREFNQFYDLKVPCRRYYLCSVPSLLTIGADFLDVQLSFNGTPSRPSSKAWSPIAKHTQSAAPRADTVYRQMQRNSQTLRQIEYHILQRKTQSTLRYTPSIRDRVHPIAKTSISLAGIFGTLHDIARHTKTYEKVAKKKHFLEHMGEYSAAGNCKSHLRSSANRHCSNATAGGGHAADVLALYIFERSLLNRCRFETILTARKGMVLSVTVEKMAVYSNLMTSKSEKHDKNASRHA